VRVTHVVHDLHGGGFESLIATMARRLAGSPVVLSAISLSGREGRVGGHIRPLLDQYHVLQQQSPLSMLVPLALTRAIRTTCADIVHLHSGVWYKGALAARRAGVGSVVYTEHGREHRDPPLMRLLDRLASRRTDAVVSVSDRLARYMASAVGVRPELIVTIRNGVDTDQFSPGAAPDALRRSLSIPDGALVVGSIGRLAQVKAYERLIEAVARLRAAGLTRPVHAVIWGDGEERPALEAKVRQTGLSGIVHLPGWTETPVLAHRLLDVFALTSHSEGTSVSLLESLACGTAPAVMDVGANADVLGPTLIDQLVPAGDLEAFVSVLSATLHDPERRRRAGEAGRARVVAQYSFDAMMAGYRRLYERLASRDRGADRRAAL
jgi:glycosyltransferase involved in cell wall biosynthesis